MVSQRLYGGATLEAAVLQLLAGLPDSFWPQPCKRIRDWREHGKVPSSNAGAYNQAQQALPISVVEKSCDHIFEQLVVQMNPLVAEGAPRAFLLDGSSMRAAHTPELCKAYPPGSNQHGESHWPLLRVVVAHDLDTGLAMRPEWGAMHGDQAVSEQALLEKAMDRLPDQATLIADCNFGVFSVAYAAVQRKHDIVLRLTPQRAQRLAGEALHDGIDRVIVWKPSRGDRKSHPDLPPDAAIQGRLLVRQVQPNNKTFLLALFTTAPSSVEVFQLYGKRWTIETDLRTLKSTLGLDQLMCSTPDMVAKEIVMGITAYNLVRALIGVASQQSGISPRSYRFTKVRLIMQTFAPLLAHAPDEQVSKHIWDQIMKHIQESTVPKRKRKRPPYPREIWQRGASFPSRKK